MTVDQRGRTRGRDQVTQGQALVEFAFVAPFLLLVILGIFEAGRFVFFHEMVNHATREGARYAIVHGAFSACPSGPMPGGATNPCDPPGARVMDAVADAALGIAGAGDLFVYDPVWSPRGSLSPPSPGATSLGHNGRGEYVTVFVDYSYEPVFNDLLGRSFLPTIMISAESTLVVNN
jgi:hypothetical protein